MGGARRNAGAKAGGRRAGSWVPRGTPWLGEMPCTPMPALCRDGEGGEKGPPCPVVSGSVSRLGEAEGAPDPGSCRARYSVSWSSSWLRRLQPARRWRWGSRGRAPLARRHQCCWESSGFLGIRELWETPHARPPHPADLPLVPVPHARTRAVALEDAPVPSLGVPTEGKDPRGDAGDKAWGGKGWLCVGR